MIIGTTPTIVFKFKRNSTVNLSVASKIYITFKQGLNILTKTGTDINIIDAKTASVTLTQQESLNFVPDKKVEVQLNWLYTESNVLVRAATKVVTLGLDK